MATWFGLSRIGCTWLRQFHWITHSSPLTCPKTPFINGVNVRTYCAQEIRPYRVAGHQIASLKKGKKRRYKYSDFPQPELKPIGPEDYHRWRYFLNRPKRQPAEPKEVTVEEEETCQAVFSKVNEQIDNRSHGRLFAVIRLGAGQFKITAEDIIIVKDNFAPTIGEVIRLEKVLLVGGSDFTLVGRPLLSKDLVRIEATVIEKTLSSIITHFRFRRRKQYRRIKFTRTPYTMLRINSIEFQGRVNELQDVEGAEDRTLA